MRIWSSDITTDMKKKVIIPILLGTALLSLHFYSLDGVHGNMMSLIFNPDTEYSEGYSDKAFRKIEVGQKKEDVIQLLGEPISSSQPKKKTREVLWYSHSPSGGDYRLRTVTIIDGRVSAVTNSYYVD